VIEDEIKRAEAGLEKKISTTTNPLNSMHDAEAAALSGLIRRK